MTSDSWIQSPVYFISVFYMIELIIFDRDDTLNIDIGFTYRTEDCKLVEGAQEVVGFVKSKGLKIAIASNQSGVGEGFYSLSQMRKFNSTLFKKLGLRSDTYFSYCPHPRKMEYRCACRKPSPYLILEVCTKFNISPSNTVFIGDSISDQISAQRAGCEFIYVDPLLGHKRTIDNLRKVIEM